jgi:transglutaminase-like putative cysteine protease
MRYAVEHKTVYRYEGSVSISHHLLRLTPRQVSRQTLLSHALNVRPTPAVLASHTDAFGNAVYFMTMEGPHTELEVLATSEVIVTPSPARDPAETEPWETVRDRVVKPGPEELEASEAVYSSPLAARSDALAQYCQPSFPPGTPILRSGMDLMRRINEEFQFDPKATTVSTPLEQVLRQRRGVCQDFAHLQIACLRSIGLPARYVSGYLETVPPPGKPRLVGADASHAWVQLWCGKDGWVDLDPTNNVLPSERHITLAWGRDFGDVSPLRGVLMGSGGHQLEVAVDVVPKP